MSLNWPYYFYFIQKQFFVMHSKPEERRLLHPSYAELKFMLEPDGIYHELRSAEEVCKQLNKVNEEDQSSISQFLDKFPQDSIAENQRMSTQILTPVEDFLSFSLQAAGSLIDSEDLSQIYSSNAQETQRTESHSLDMEFKDSGGPTKNSNTPFDQLIIDRQKITCEDRADSSLKQSRNPQGSKRSKKSSKIVALSSKEKAYNKNLSCYIPKTVRRMMLGKFSAQVEKKCLKAGVTYKDFTVFCDEKKFNGFNALVSLFTESSDEYEMKMKCILKNLFQKILKRAYLRTAIEEGKMMDLEAYTTFKNKYLLYLDQIQKE